MSKEKQKTNISVIDRKLAKALLLTKAKEGSRYAIDYIYFNSEKKELVVTNGSNLLIIEIKPTGLLMDTYKLETGSYKIEGNMLFKVDSKNINFPEYQDIIPKGDILYTGNIFTGVFVTMILSRKILNIFGRGIAAQPGIEAVLKILNGFSIDWSFISPTCLSPVLMKMENREYKIQYVTMPYPALDEIIKTDKELNKRNGK